MNEKMIHDLSLNFLLSNTVLIHCHCSKMQYIKKIKKEHRFQKYINEVWYKCKYFNLKSFIAILLFRFRLDYIYIILFYIKEKF